MNIDTKVMKQFKKTYQGLQGVSLIGEVWHSFNNGIEYEACILVYCEASMNCALLPSTYDGYAVLIQKEEL